jgi:lysophospholipase L1-like esterase
MRWGALAGYLILAAATTATGGGQPGGMGVGVIGDSYSDEYQFYPPDRPLARNWVEILAESRGVNFGPFTTTDRGLPRHQGYAYNWSRTAATTADAIEQGQHTGLAAQIARGEVGLAWVFIGGNDLIAALHAPDPLDALPSASAQAAANLDRIVSTLLEASPDVQVAVVTVPDILELPEFAGPLADGRLPRAWATAAGEALRRYNAHIKGLRARDRRIAVVDLFLSQQAARMLAPRGLTLAGRRIIQDRPGNDVDHLFLADGRHLGTVGQGLMARLFVATLNARFDGRIRPLEDRELWDLAGRLPQRTPALAERRQPPPPEPRPGS